MVGLAPFAWMPRTISASASPLRATSITFAPACRRGPGGDEADARACAGDEDDLFGERLQLHSGELRGWGSRRKPSGGAGVPASPKEHRRASGL
jgi:hypothetical protein